MSDKDKIKALLQSNQRHNQIIAIQLMCSLEWLLDDCALFCFLNIKPNVSKTFGHWRKSYYKIGSYDIVFDRESKNTNAWMSAKYNDQEPPNDEDYYYNCKLFIGHDKNTSGGKYTIVGNPFILIGNYPMELNPPVLKYFGTAVLLNLE